MKLFYFLIFPITLTIQNAHTEGLKNLKCDVLSKKLFGKVEQGFYDISEQKTAKPLYAAQRLLKRPEFIVPAISPVSFAMIDLGDPNNQGSHANQVRSLISGEHSILKNASLAYYFDFEKEGSYEYQFLYPTPDRKSYAKALGEIIEYNKAKPMSEKIRVVNISTDVPFLFFDLEGKEILKKIESDNEINIVWAAGNFDPESSPGRISVQMPYEFETKNNNAVVVVSAGSDDPTRITSYSNFGYSIDFSVPIDEGVKTSFELPFTGTSAAAPLVSAAFIALHQANPNLPARLARAILKATATDQGRGGRDVWFGYGRPNIELAVWVAQNLIKGWEVETNENELVEEIRDFVENRSKNQRLRGLLKRKTSFKNCDEVEKEWNLREKSYYLGQSNEDICELIGVMEKNQVPQSSSVNSKETKSVWSWANTWYCGANETANETANDTCDTPSSKLKRLSVNTSIYDVKMNTLPQELITQDPVAASYYLLSSRRLTKVPGFFAWYDQVFEMLKGKREMRVFAYAPLLEPQYKMGPDFIATIKELSKLDPSSAIVLMTQKEFLEKNEADIVVRDLIERSWASHMFQNFLFQKDVRAHPRWKEWLDLSLKTLEDPRQRQLAEKIIKQF